MLSYDDTSCCWLFCLTSQVLCWDCAHKVTLYASGLLQNSSITLSEIVSCGKPNGLEFTICNKFNPKVSPTGPHIHWALLPAVSTDNRRRAEWAISNFNVVKLALPGWLYGVLFIKVQVDALPRRCYKRTMNGQWHLRPHKRQTYTEPASHNC